MIVGGYLCQFNPHLMKSPEDFLNLLLPETSATKVGQNAVVPDNTELGPLSWVV
jgi:hypothetical protein